MTKRGVTLGYLIRDGKVLLLERIREPNKGLWSPPGGKVEPCESPEECMRREYLEETGLTPGRMELAGYLTQFAAGSYDVLMFLFRILDATGEVVEGDGGPLAWAPVEDLATWPMPRADRLFTPKVLDPALRFFRARFEQTPEGEVLDATFYEEIPRA